MRHIEQTVKHLEEKKRKTACRTKNNQQTTIDEHQISGIY